MATEAHILANLPKYPPLYICREPSTNPPIFMQNKPNFLNNQMNLNSDMTNNYEHKTPLRPPPKQTQTNPISNPLPLARPALKPMQNHYHKLRLETFSKLRHINRGKFNQKLK
ncbi:MAG: hypothetical protein ACYS1A_10170 [Planctomycetota bacterium]|jgi:hypothetical protein